MKFKGFTLLELLITVSLFSILMMLGSFSWIHLKQNNELTLLVDEIKNVVHYAKIQALSRGHSLLLSPADHSLNWSNGFVLNQVDKQSKKEELLYQWKWSHYNWSIEWFGANGTKNIIFSDNAAGAMSNGRFVLTNNHTRARVVLVLNRLGRIKVA